MILLTLACVPYGDVGTPPIARGPAEDTGEEDPANPEDSDPPVDTSPPAEPVGEACYPGPDWDWTACVGVVDWDPAWGDDYEYPDPYGGSAQYAAPVRFVDLSVEDPGMQLAPNFQLDELMQEYKGRYGVFQAHTVESLQALRDSLGPTTVNSGYRNPAYNAKVGGVSSSRHQYGDAVDIGASASLSTIGALCEEEGADYVGYYEAHVHCDWRNSPLDGSFYDVDTAARAAALPPALSATLVPGEAWTAPAEGWDEGEPLREWRAYDAEDRLIAEQTGRSFTPPEGSARVEVVVGRALTLAAPTR